MSFALVKDGVIQTEDFPRFWYDGIRLWDFRTNPPDSSTGWIPVIDTDRPEDTYTTTYSRTLELIDGQPTVVWMSREKSAEELEMQVRAGNVASLRADAIEQINVLINSVTELNAITDLTNATIRNDPAPIIKDLTRICKTVARQTIRVARLVTDETTSADAGTE